MHVLLRECKQDGLNIMGCEKQVDLSTPYLNVLL